MPLLLVRANGITELRARLAAASTAMRMAPEFAITKTLRFIADELAAAAPRAAYAEEPMPPAGDGPGHLADSFIPQVAPWGDAGAAGNVYTTQPTKLRYIRYGTGIYGPRGQRIYPVIKKALYWADAPHPYRSVAGIKPNDFVTPILALADPAVAAGGIDEYVTWALEPLRG